VIAEVGRVCCTRVRRQKNSEPLHLLSLYGVDRFLTFEFAETVPLNFLRLLIKNKELILIGRMFDGLGGMCSSTCRTVAIAATLRPAGSAAGQSLKGHTHCSENPIYVFPEKKLHGLSPNFHIHVSVSSTSLI
jgi:hypothetical protein